MNSKFQHARMVESFETYDSIRKCEDECTKYFNCHCYSYNHVQKLCFLFEACSRYDANICSKHKSCGHIDINPQYISNEMGGCLTGILNNCKYSVN